MNVSDFLAPSTRARRYSRRETTVLMPTIMCSTLLFAFRATPPFSPRSAQSFKRFVQRDHGTFWYSLRHA
jgi:hypothetical protein